MRGRLLIVVVLVVFGALVAAFNWEAMTQVVAIDLMFVSFATTVGALVALVTAVLVTIFVLGGLIDRARYLRQLSQLERHLEEARAELDRARAEDLERLALEVGERLEAVRSGLDGSLARLEDAVVARIDAVQDDLDARVDGVRERVVVVRDELAADIAEVEDALLRGGAPRGHVGPDLGPDLVEEEPEA